MNEVARVATPPSKPLLVFDGDCGFCTLWIQRWQQMTGDAVDYAALQEPRITEQFPELSRAQLEQAVHFIEPDGSVYRGAEAVFRSLAIRRKWPLYLYENVPGFAAGAEFFYRLVARHRSWFSFVTRALWGP